MRIHLTAMLLAATAGIPLFGASKANVELVLVEPGGKAGAKRVSISRKATPGPGKELRVVVAGTGDSVVSVAAFNRKGDLLSVPDVTTITGNNKPRELPERAKWMWEAPETIADVYVVLTTEGASDFSTYRTLVTKMAEGGTSTELRKMQTSSVLRWIEAHLKSKTTAADYSMKSDPTPMGGLIRGTEGFGVPIDVPDGRSVVMRIRLEP